MRSLAPEKGAAMFRLRALILLTAAAMTSGVVLLGGTAHAVAGSTWIHQAVGRSASGAAVVAQISLACPAGSTFGLSGFVLTQRLPDNSIASASGQQFADGSGTCNGSTRTVRMSGIATEKPFVIGPAFASSRLTICNTTTCSEQTLVRTVAVQALTIEKATFSRPYFNVSLPAQAIFEANGAGAIVRVPYRCANTFEGSVYARLGQRRGTSVLHSSAGTSLVCSASNRLGVLVFNAAPYPWRLGDAFVELEGQVVNYPAGQVASGIFAFRTLNLVRPAA